MHKRTRGWLAASMSLMMTPALAQQIDMDAVKRWDAAKVAHFHIVGVFDGWTGVSDWAVKQDRESGEVHASDTVTLDFDWNIREQKIVGAATFSNAATRTKGTRNKADARIAPVLKGAYEHLVVTAVVAESGGALILNGIRRFPDAQLALDYPGSMAMKPVKAEQVKVVERLAVPDPKMMGMASFMPAQTTSTGTQMSFTPDKKSFVMTLDGWTWTYTPTVVK